MQWNFLLYWRWNILSAFWTIQWKSIKYDLRVKKLCKAAGGSSIFTGFLRQQPKCWGPAFLSANKVEDRTETCALWRGLSAWHMVPITSRWGCRGKKANPSSSILALPTQVYTSSHSSDSAQNASHPSPKPKPNLSAADRQATHGSFILMKRETPQNI